MGVAHAPHACWILPGSAKSLYTHLLFSFSTSALSTEGSRETGTEPRPESADRSDTGRGNTGRMHARWSAIAEAGRGRGVVWPLTEASSSSSIGRLSLGGGERGRSSVAGPSTLCKAAERAGGACVEDGASLRERHRRSICEPIREESSPSRGESVSRDGYESEQERRTTRTRTWREREDEIQTAPSSPSKARTSISLPSPVSDIAFDVYKRHHRPRAPPVRSLSAPLLPLLISTNTTKPVHINHP